MIYPTRLGKSAIHGKGAFSLKGIPARKKIGNMGGTIITVNSANMKMKGLNVISMVELGNGKVLDGTLNGNDLSYVNHSCTPNTFTRVIGDHVEFYALRHIQPGQELTCSYGESYHEGKRRCTCGGEQCEGFL